MPRLAPKKHHVAPESTLLTGFATRESIGSTSSQASRSKNQQTAGLVCYKAELLVCDRIGSVVLLIFMLDTYAMYSRACGIQLVNVHHVFLMRAMAALTAT